MTKEEFKPILRNLSLAYPSFNLSSEQMDFWLSMFAECQANHFEKAVLGHIRDVKYNPTIASIHEKLNETPKPPNPGQWPPVTEDGYLDVKRMMELEQEREREKLGKNPATKP